IDRNYPEPERLLGEHRWSEFLKKPNAEDQGRVSQIFYSTYATGRQAKKGICFCSERARLVREGG
ncbi:hypothetical protein B0H14DRAFT_2371965, partial [Mycena olivaceomarginata]